MKNNHCTALKSFGRGQGKDKYFQGQKQRIFTSFLKNSKTIVEPSKPECNE